MNNILQDNTIKNVFKKIEQYKDDIVVRTALFNYLGYLLYGYDSEYLFKEYGISIETDHCLTRNEYIERLSIIGYDKLNKYFQ